MSCCVSKLDLCRLVQESYKSPTFNFGDTDVTNDTFVYKVKIAGESFTEYPCTVIAPNIVVIDEYTLPVGNYIHEMLWTSANGTELIFQGGLKITSVGSCCGSNRNNTIKVIQNETVVRINVTESNITIENSEWGSIEGDINEQTDLIELVDNAVNDMATQTWVENQNYLTEETDPTVPSHVKSITTTDISNWNGKQNQLTAGTNISIVGNTISSIVNLNGYATETWVNSQGFALNSDLPTVGNGTITITQGGVPKGSFTTNQSGNTTVEIDAGGADLMVEITHADLLALVNNNGLTPGQQYRITDYVATVDTDVYNPDSGFFYARSNNHAFDIIVTADSVNKLNENARAIRHEGDTYFPSHTKFEVWQMKYTILNDSERFSWVLSTGKGVVYQLIDEFNNDVAYDFKSIQFQRNDVWVYTFGGAKDGSLELENCYNNTVLNSGMNLSDNTFGNYCVSNTFGGYCSSNTFGDGCESNTFGDYCSSNTFGDSCRLNTFGADCSSNTFGDSCRLNTFGDDCYSNTFGYNCYSNKFGYNCYSNTFGDMYSNYNISSFISNIDFVSEITNFTTTPNGNVVNVIKTPSGVVFSQVINATTTESFDV